MRPARKIWYRTNFALQVLLMAGILGMIAAFAIAHNLRFDLTKTKRYTLSPQSSKILKELKDPVKAIAFYQEGSSEWKAARELLEQYRYYSDKFSYELVDPDKRPAVAKEYEIASYGTIVIECRGRVEKIFDLTEEELTNAIVRATRKGKKKILFVKGHGEHDLEDFQRSGYSMVKKALEDQNYEVSSLVLLREGEVPKGTAVLVLAGPKKDLLPKEIEAIKRYLEDGGKLLALVDPPTVKNVKAFLKEYGLLLQDDIIIDRVSRVLGGDYLIPVVSLYEPHPITKDFRLASFFPLAQSISLQKEPPKGVELVPLAKTAPQSWGEVDRRRLKEKGEASFEEGKDHKGPLIVAAVATKKVGGKRKARIVLFGDSDFATNAHFGISGNGDLFLNAVSWLAEEEELIAIRPRPTNFTPLFLSRSEARWLFWLCVVVLPGGVAATGAITAIRRWKR